MNLLLYGGAIFGVVDHLWNGELFLLRETPLMDLLLGFTITATIFGGWGMTLCIANKSQFSPPHGDLKTEREALISKASRRKAKGENK